MQLDYFEYLHMHLTLFPSWIQVQYSLAAMAYKEFVQLEMRQAVWGLPQAGIHADKCLQCKLAPFGYYKHVKTPGLWYYKTRPISFTLVVDNLGVKYFSQEDIAHFIGAIILTYYTLTKDWTGNLYCGIALDWDCKNRAVNILMPGYIKEKLQEYNHVKTLQRIQTCSYSPAPKQYGTKAQAPLPPNQSPHLDEEGNQRVQQIVGSILYYMQAVDMMVLMALSTIMVEQTTATEHTMAKFTQSLDYLSDHADAKIQFHASNMIMNIHSDASYLLEANAWSRVCGHFFMGWMPEDDEPIRLNGAFYVSMNIMRFVVASVAEAELGALYRNCKKGIIYWEIFKDMGHPQSKIPVHCNNATAVGIANNTVKWQHSCSMEMHFFWVSDKCAQDMYKLSKQPGQENLADYQSKHHSGAHHAAVHPWYLHMDNYPSVLPTAEAPSALKGCVGTLDNGYQCKVPLPRAQRVQSPVHVTCNMQITRDNPYTCYSEVPRIPTWSDLSRSLASLGRTTILPFAHVWLM